MSESNKEFLALKWGTLKSWNFKNPKILELLDEYDDIGSSVSAMMQKDTDRQKEIICEIIDLVDTDVIHNDWSGFDMTKEQAKDYVMNYGLD